MTGDSSLAAVVNTMNMLFQPDLMLATRASTICDTHLPRAPNKELSTLPNPKLP